MLQVYDRVLSSRSVPTLVALSIFLVGAYAFQGVLDLIHSRYCSISALPGGPWRMLRRRAAANVRFYGCHTRDRSDAWWQLDGQRASPYRRRITASSVILWWLIPPGVMGDPAGMTVAAQPFARILSPRALHTRDRLCRSPA
jgi:hypothetical protein